MNVITELVASKRKLDKIRLVIAQELPHKVAMAKISQIISAPVLAPAADTVRSK